MEKSCSLFFPAKFRAMQSWRSIWSIVKAPQPIILSCPFKLKSRPDSCPALNTDLETVKRYLLVHWGIGHDVRPQFNLPTGFLQDKHLDEVSGDGHVVFPSHLVFHIYLPITFQPGLKKWASEHRRSCYICLSSCNIFPNCSGLSDSGEGSEGWFCSGRRCVRYGLVALLVVSRGGQCSWLTPLPSSWHWWTGGTGALSGPQGSRMCCGQKSCWTWPHWGDPPPTGCSWPVTQHVRLPTPQLNQARDTVLIQLPVASGRIEWQRRVWKWQWPPPLQQAAGPWSLP